VKFAALVAVSCLYGWLAARLFRGVVWRPAVNRMVAHVLSFRLFIDEPRLVFRAQWALICENFRLLRMVAVPCLVLGLAFWGVDGYFGGGPVAEAGQVLVASAPIGEGLPEGLVEETPGVRVERLGRVYWRVRATRESGRTFGAPWWVWFCGISLAVNFRWAFFQRGR
jgi:hypothetical protein